MRGPTAGEGRVRGGSPVVALYICLVKVGSVGVGWARAVRIREKALTADTRVASGPGIRNPNPPFSDFLTHRGHSFWCPPPPPGEKPRHQFWRLQLLSPRGTCGRLNARVRLRLLPSPIPSHLNILHSTALGLLTPPPYPPERRSSPPERPLGLLRAVCGLELRYLAPG